MFRRNTIGGICVVILLLGSTTHLATATPCDDTVENMTVNYSRMMEKLLLLIEANVLAMRVAAERPGELSSDVEELLTGPVGYNGNRMVM